ncbi:MAG TPA: hypothetical protein VFQ38_15840 [Longimicrobiales bacterium]|nr:hypothetical protein [Longimicrobiales bacterium]
MHRTLGRITASSLLAGLGMVAPLRAQSPKLALRDDPQNGRIVVTLSPIDLPAGAPHGGMTEPPAQTVVIPRDGWLQGYGLEMVDRNGRPVPRAVVHHLNLIMPDRRELFSPIMLRIGAMGSETAPVKLPRLLGLRVRKGERLLVTTMLHNPTGRSYQGVEMRISMPFVDGGTWIPPFSVHPFYMDVMPPAGIHEYDLPAGKSQKSWEGKPSVAARVLGVGGHLHRYATLLRFEDVTAKTVLWEARPQLDATGDVVGMPRGKFWWKGGIKVEPEHVYRLTAFYDNPTGHAIPGGGMGALGGIVVPSGGAKWPRVDLGDPELQRDLEVTYGGMPMEHGGQPMQHGGHEMRMMGEAAPGAVGTGGASAAKAAPPANVDGASKTAPHRH